MRLGVKYKQEKLVIDDKPGEATVNANEISITQAFESDAQLNEFRISVYVRSINPAVVRIEGFPTVLYFSLVFIGAILASKFALGEAFLHGPVFPLLRHTLDRAVVIAFFVFHASDLRRYCVSRWLECPRGWR